MSYQTTNYPGYVKDTTSGHVSAVLNTDSVGLADYRAQRARLLKVDRLESEVAELKQMIKEFLGTNNV
jgi:hypothetical protein